MRSRRRADLVALACLVFSIALVGWDTSRRHAAETQRVEQASAATDGSLSKSRSWERDIEAGLTADLIEPSLKHLSRFHVHLTFGNESEGESAPTRMRVVLRSAIHHDAAQEEQLRQTIRRKLRPEYPQCVLDVSFEKAPETVTPLGTHYDL